MFTGRKYTIGDRVFVLVKGSPTKNGALRQILSTNRNMYRTADLQAEPLYLMEGFIGSIRQNLDPATNRVASEDDTQARTITVITYPYEDIVGEEPYYVEYGLSDDFADMLLNTAQLAIGKQIRTEEQWKFAVRFLYPEVVVEQGYSRLLSDLVSAFNPQPAEIKPSDRQAVIDEATRLGFAVRTMPLCGYRARWPLSETTDVNAVLGRYAWANISPALLAQGG